MAHKKPCYPCGGKGTIFTIGDQVCHKCGGTGKKYQPGVGMNVFFPCPYCKGRGKQTGVMYKKTCGSCSGKGYKY